MLTSSWSLVHTAPMYCQWLDLVDILSSYCHRSILKPIKEFLLPSGFRQFRQVTAVSWLLHTILSLGSLLCLSQWTGVQILKLIREILFFNDMQCLLAAPLNLLNRHIVYIWILLFHRSACFLRIKNHTVLNTVTLFCVL